MYLMKIGEKGEHFNHTFVLSGLIILSTCINAHSWYTDIKNINFSVNSRSLYICNWSCSNWLGFYACFRPVVCLEVGSGSGVVSAFLASVTGAGALYLWVCGWLVISISFDISILLNFSKKKEKKMLNRN